MPLFPKRNAQGQFISNQSMNDLEAAFYGVLHTKSQASLNYFRDLWSHTGLKGDPFDYIFGTGAAHIPMMPPRGAPGTHPVPMVHPNFPRFQQRFNQAPAADPYFRLLSDIDKTEHDIRSILNKQQLAIFKPTPFRGGPGTFAAPASPFFFASAPHGPTMGFAGGMKFAGAGQTAAAAAQNPTFVVTPNLGGAGGGGGGTGGGTGGGRGGRGTGGGSAGFGGGLGLGALIRRIPHLGAFLGAGTLAELGWGAFTFPQNLGHLEEHLISHAQPFLNLRMQTARMAQPSWFSSSRLLQEIMPSFGHLGLTGALPEWMARLGLGPAQAANLIQQFGGLKPMLSVKELVSPLAGMGFTPAFANIPQATLVQSMRQQMALGVAPEGQPNKFLVDISGVMKQSYLRSGDQLRVLENINASTEIMSRMGAGTLSGAGIADFFGRIMTGSNAPGARTGELAAQGIAGINQTFNHPLANPFGAMTMARILQNAGPLSNQANLAKLVGGEARLKALQGSKDPFTLAALKALPAAQASGQMALALLAYVQLMRGGGEGTFVQQFSKNMPGLPGNMPPELRTFLSLVAAGVGTGMGAQGVGALLGGKGVKPDQATVDAIKKAYPGIPEKEARAMAEAAQAGVYGSYISFREFAQFIPDVNNALRNLAKTTGDVVDWFQKLIGAPAANTSPTLVPGGAITAAGKLGLIMKDESGGRNIRNAHFDAFHTASGYFQITDSTWKQFAYEVPGAMMYAHAIDAPYAVQAAVASHIPLSRWTDFNPKLRHDLAMGEGGGHYELGHSIDTTVHKLNELHAAIGDFSDHVHTINRKFNGMSTGLSPVNQNSVASPYLRISP